MRRAPACHSRNATVRKAAAKRARGDIAVRRNEQCGKPERKRRTPKGRQHAAADGVRGAKVAIARRRNIITPTIMDSQKRVYVRLVRSDGTIDMPALYAHRAARTELVKGKRTEWVAGWRARNAASSGRCRFRRSGCLQVAVPAQGSGGEARIIDVHKVVCTVALSDEDSDKLKKIDVTARLIGLSNSRRGGANHPRLPKKMMGGVLPAECWSNGLLGSENTWLGADESFALYVEEEAEAEPRFVCCVLRCALSAASHAVVHTAALRSTAGHPHGWFEWMKGCGASGIPTMLMLLDLIRPGSRKARLYFGSDLRTFLLPLNNMMHVTHPNVPHNQPYLLRCTHQVQGCRTGSRT